MEDILRLTEIAYEVRMDIIRMTHAAGCGHPGGSLSSVDILTVLFFNEIKNNPKEPKSPERDFYIQSKGHATPALYGILSKRGYIPHEELLTFRKFGSRLQGHPEKEHLPFLEASTGSLGQGLSIACGMAIGLKLRKSKSRVYCLLGDGEMQEGQIWEAMMSAGHRRLDNLCVIVDHNHLQIDGVVDEIKNPDPITKKAKAFGWHSFSIDGHNIENLLEGFTDARRTMEKPTLIVAETLKGKGVSFMENNVEFHGKAPNDEEARIALAELTMALEAIRG